jgi:small conductance mechanosensitive channel
MTLRWLTSEEFWVLVQFRALSIIGIVLLMLLVRFVAYRLIDRVLRSLTARESGATAIIAVGRIRTLGGLIKSILFYVIIFVGGVMILRVFSFDPTAILTAAGVVGVAVGFGAQKLVRDIISGFFILLENQYSVGEYITIGAVTGTVVELGMRVTRLRDDVGKLIIIANGDITLVTNHSRGPIHANLEVSVAPDSDLTRVRAVIDSVGSQVAGQVEGILTPPACSGVTAMDSTKITLRISSSVSPGRQDAVQLALREALRQRFIEEDIKLG